MGMENERRIKRGIYNEGGQRKVLVNYRCMRNWLNKNLNSEGRSAKGNEIRRNSRRMI